MAELFRKTEKRQLAGKLLSWAKRLRTSLAQVAASDGLLCDGLTSTGKRVKTRSIHSQTLAILAGFHPEHDEARLEKVILPFIREQETPAISPSCYWITYVFEVLTAKGYGAEVIEFIRKRWAPMADYGTTWEVFEPLVGDQSFSHAWSAHPLYHLMEIIGGIRQSGPAWKKILFEPIFVGDRADTTIPTPHGPIRSSWARVASSINVRLELPDGISAKVAFPGKRPENVSGDTRWIIAQELTQERPSSRRGDWGNDPCPPAYDPLQKIRILPG
jgi:hypothetical protein